MVINSKKLSYLYWTKKLTIREMALLYHVSHVTILSWLKKYKIKTRTHSESQLGRMVSDKTRLKMSLKKKGQIPWIKGKHHKKSSILLIIKNNFMKGKFGKLHHNFKGGKERFRCSCGRIKKNRYAKRCWNCWIIYKFNHPEVHYNWQCGISKLPYSFKFTKKLKESIRRRDNYECRNCNKTEKQELEQYYKVLSVHHIDYNKQNCKEDNLITLCNECNHRVNASRDYWYAYFKYIIVRRK